MWIDEATGVNATWSRIRLVDRLSALPIQNVDEMRPLAAQDRLGLCNFSYGPVNTSSSSNAGDVQHGWAVSANDDCIRLMVVEQSNEAVVVNGYISPIVVILTLITNSLVCAVLLQKHMRTPTNVFLVALAVSDALTGIVPLPVFIHFYTFGAYRSILVPPTWCHVYMPMSLHVPAMWHTASIWLTVGLAFQRYIYICHHQVAKRLCTVRNAVIAIIVVYVAAIMTQLCRNFENRYETISLDVPLGAADVENRSTGRISIRGCSFELQLGQYEGLYFSTYWNFRIIFIHLIPCILLVGLNARLFLAMRRAQAHHCRLLHENLHSESRRLTETNMTTLMLLVVVGVFLLVEFPLAVMMMTMIIENTSPNSLVLIDPGVRETAALLINLVILFSYPVNFFIYCGMSQQFRQTFCQLFVRKAAAVVLGAPTPTEPSRCPDVDDQGNDAGKSGSCEQMLCVEQVDVDQNADHEVFNMTVIVERQQQN